MSEKSLDQLIATLKEEAIEAAENKVIEILENAKAQALKIVKEAEAKGSELIEDAHKEAQVSLNKGEAALKQAVRDVTVSVRNDLLKLLKIVLSHEVENSFSPELVEKAVLTVVENVGSGVALQIPANKQMALAENLQSRLQSSNDIDKITKDSNLLKGFVVTKTDQGWSYEITPEEVTELLNKHLSPRWADMLKNASEG